MKKNLGLKKSSLRILNDRERQQVGGGIRVDDDQYTIWACDDATQVYNGCQPQTPTIYCPPGGGTGGYPTQAGCNTVGIYQCYTE